MSVYDDLDALERNLTRLLAAWIGLLALISFLLGITIGLVVA